jgi:hypothetical protein
MFSQQGEKVGRGRPSPAPRRWLCFLLCKGKRCIAFRPFCGVACPDLLLQTTQVEFAAPVDAKGNIEVWLQRLVDGMQGTIKSGIKRAVHNVYVSGADAHLASVHVSHSATYAQTHTLKTNNK